MACCRDTVEDRGTVQYLQDCAAEAGLATEFLYVEDIGLGEKGQFTDLQGSGDWQSVQALSVGVYAAGDVLHQAGRRWRPLAGAGVEKHYLQQGAAADAVEMFPNHPNLLAAYFSEDTHPEMEKYVIKPIFSRERVLTCRSLKMAKWWRQ